MTAKLGDKPKKTLLVAKLGDEKLFKVFTDTSPTIWSPLSTILGWPIESSVISGLFVQKLNGRLRLWSEKWGQIIWDIGNAGRDCTMAQCEEYCKSHMGDRYCITEMKHNIARYEDWGVSVSDVGSGTKTFLYNGKFVFKTIEYIEEAVEFFGLNKFFDNIFNHYTANSMLKNTIYIMSRVWAPRGKNIRYTVLNIKKPFDATMDIILPETSPNSTPEEIRIMTATSANPVAILYPEYRSVITCDFSHENEMEWFMPVWDQIVTGLQLKPKNTISNKVMITLGTDPEFEMLTTKGVIPSTPEFQGEMRMYGKIGTDGHAATLEIRPDFAPSHKEIIQDLRGSFKKMRSCMISTKGDHEAIGAHLHFGVKRNGILGHFPYHRDIGILLDYFLGIPFERLNGKARQAYFDNNGQSYLSNIREQPHGFEYRSLPAAAFSDPRIARIVMSAGQNLMQNYIDKIPITINADRSHYDQEFVKYCEIGPSDFQYMRRFIEKYPAKGKGDISRFWINRKHLDNPEVNVAVVDLQGKDVTEKFNTQASSLSLTKVPVNVDLYIYITDNQPRGYVTGINHSHNKKYNKDCQLWCKKGLAFGVNVGDFGTNVVNRIKAKLGEMFNMEHVPDKPTSSDIWSSFCESGNTMLWGNERRRQVRIEGMDRIAENDARRGNDNWWDFDEGRPRVRMENPFINDDPEEEER